MSGQNIWEILTAVGTLGAVVVALFLPMWQSRRRLSVQVATPGGGLTQEKDASVIITNNGGKAITVIRVKANGNDGKMQEVSEAGQISTLPCTLRSSDFVSLTFPYISAHLDQIKEIQVEDSLGRLWKCNPKSHRTALAIRTEKREMLESFYPSMQKEKGKKAKTRRRN